MFSLIGLPAIIGFAVIATMAWIWLLADRSKTLSSLKADSSPTRNVSGTAMRVYGQLAIFEDHLTMTERHVAEGERHLARRKIWSG